MKKALALAAVSAVALMSGITGAGAQMSMSETMQKQHEQMMNDVSDKESLTHGINVSISENKISLDFHVIVSYGVSISAVTDNLINNVKYKVEEFTGMEIEKINILVEGVRVID